MKRLAFAFALLLSWPIAAQKAPRILVVKCGTLIADLASSPIKNATILIRDGDVAAVGTQPAALTADTEVLDLSAYTVMPGLLDAHTHLWTGPLTSMTTASDPLATLRAAKAVAFALNSGVVAMRTVGG